MTDELAARNHSPHGPRRDREVGGDGVHRKQDVRRWSTHGWPVDGRAAPPSPACNRGRPSGLRAVCRLSFCCLCIRSPRRRCSVSSPRMERHAGRRRSDSTETAGDDRSTRRHAHPTVIEPTRIAWSRLRPRMGQQLPSRSSYLVPQEKFVVTPSTANPAQREQPGYRTRDGGSAACKDLRSRGFMTSEGRSADGPRARPRMWRTGRGAPHDKRRTSVAKPASTCNYNKSGMVLDQGVSGDQRAKQGVPACSILHA